MIEVKYLYPYCNSKNIEGLVRMWINLNEPRIVKNNDYCLSINSPIYCKNCNKVFSCDELKINLGNYTSTLKNL